MEKEGKTKLKRAYTVADILKKKFSLFEFEGEWKDAFDCPSRGGLWFIWGDSGNGKTSFVLQLMKYMSRFDKVLFNSLEEGNAHTLQRSIRLIGMNGVENKVQVVTDSIDELTDRLSKKNSRNIVFIDSFQYLQIGFHRMLEFKEMFPKKTIVVVSQAEGKQPAGRAAKRVMFDASLKIYVDGYRALSKGRYIGETGVYTIWEEGAARIGEAKVKNDLNEN